MNIILYGAASDSIDSVYKDAVYELGREMARRGHTMVYGGGATGLMGAAANGLHDGGGGIIGVVPNFMSGIEELYDKCTELINTQTMSERKDIMESLADAFIIVPGGIGTFDEFFQILTLRSLGRMDKPIVLFNVNSFWNGMLSVIGSVVFKGFIGSGITSCFTVCESARTTIDTLEKLLCK